MSPTKRYKQDSFGSLFKRLRKDRGFSIEKLSEKTKIQEKYLEYLENEEFEKLPPDVYVRGFIVKCCTFFDNDKSDDLLRFYIQYSKINSVRSDEINEHAKQNNTSFLLTPRHIAIIGVAFFLLSLGAYLSIRFIPFLFTPTIKLSYPVGENLVVNFSNIKIEGATKYASSLTLNGKELYIGENGMFEGDFELDEGVNIITLGVKNRFGRSSEVIRRVVYIRN